MTSAGCSNCLRSGIQCPGLPNENRKWNPRFKSSVKEEEPHKRDKVRIGGGKRLFSPLSSSPDAAGSGLNSSGASPDANSVNRPMECRVRQVGLVPRLLLRHSMTTSCTIGLCAITVANGHASVSLCRHVLTCDQVDQRALWYAILRQVPPHQ